MKHSCTCALCGQTLPPEQLRHFGGKELCPHCLELHTLICRHCGRRLWASDNAGTAELPLCQDCCDAHYTVCCRCGTLISNSAAYYRDSDEDDEYPYCLTCFHTLSHDRAIHDYYYKPEPIFYGEGPRFFGVELEVDEAGEDSENARALLELANQRQPLLYIKHDGSLDEGFELVTHPMSLDAQLHTMPWQAICKEAVAIGYRSHRAGTCGLHVHVSRTAFGTSEREQDAAIARVLYFFEKHWEELLKFSRRTRQQLERWASRYGYQEHPMEILDFAKKGYHGGRYTCVNLQNTDTVEFRMFRGTLKPNTIFATLQLIDRICDCAIHFNDVELKTLAWTTFAAGCTQPELIQYLKERRLYVNEPVESEVEQ